MSYGVVIRDARKRSGMSQTELADKVGVSRSAINDWEHEAYAPTDAKNIVALETALGFKGGELYLRIHANPPSTPSPEGESKKQKPRPVMKDRHKHSKVA